MVKKLYDLSLDYVYRHFTALLNGQPAALANLPKQARESLLYRFIDHDLLNQSEFHPLITYYLINPSLASLRFYSSSQLDDLFLHHFSEVCHDLASIVLIRCLNITDQGLVDLLANQNGLKRLELRWLTIGGWSLSKAAGRGSLAQLDTLILKGCSNITPDHVLKVVLHSRQIHTLNLFGLRRMNDQICCEILSLLGSNLRQLNLSECLHITDAVLEALATHCPMLNVLSMVECMNVTECGFKRLLTSCQNLARLDVSFCVRYGENALSIDVLNVLPTAMTSLSLGGIRVSLDVSLLCQAFSRLLQLKRLNLSGFGSMSDNFLEQLLPLIGDRLEDLNLSGNFEKLTDHGLKFVAEFCTKLRNFSCALLNNINGCSLKPIFVDKNRSSILESLIFTVCSRLDYNCLSLIAENCLNLHVADFSGVPNVDDYILSTLAETCGPKLRKLLVKAPTNVTDNSVCKLAAFCPNLKCLSLSGNKNVTDRSLLVLADRCFHLQELYLSGCMMVSQAAMRYLKDRCNGRLSVYHVASSPSASAVVLARNLDTGQFVRIT